MQGVREESGKWDQFEEETLVVAAQAGDLRAFDRLVIRYRPALISLAYQILKSRELAEDATQESLLIGFSALPQLTDTSKFSTWIGAITRHRSIRVAQGERRAPTPLDEIVAAYAPSLTADLAARIQDEALRAAIAELADDLRTVTETYYLGEWSVKDIARLLDLPSTTVKWRLHTARQRLRNHLQPLIEEDNERVRI